MRTSVGAYSGYGTNDYYQAEWFENLGRGEFSDRRIVRIEDRDNSALRPVDLDGDGAWTATAMTEVACTATWAPAGSPDARDCRTRDGDSIPRPGDEITWAVAIRWHENLRVFSGERLIADDFDGDWSIVAADLDSSGDAGRAREVLEPGAVGLVPQPGYVPGAHRGAGQHTCGGRRRAALGQLGAARRPGRQRARAGTLHRHGAGRGRQCGGRVHRLGTDRLQHHGAHAWEREYEVTVQAENEAGAGPVSAAVKRNRGCRYRTPGNPFRSTEGNGTTQALEPKSVRAADLDDDTDLDALSASSEDDTIAWHENTATGFLPVRHVITASADGAGHVRTGDLDDDGDSDVVSASFDDQIVAWYENLGAGAFAAQNVIAMDASNLGSLDLADLDDDGDLDVLIAGPGEYGLEWYENLGGAVFAGSRNVAESNYNSGAIASPADLDADGDLDVLTTTSFNNGIGWHENLGSGSFSPARTITTGLESNATLSTADVDGDGDPDILHGSHREDTVAWYENRGGGDFLGRRVIATGIDDISAVTPGDLDADGDVDIIIASYDDDRIAWYENLERGRFSGARVVTMDADGAIDAIAADLDGDGDVDILAAASVGNTVAWHENLGPPN